MGINADRRLAESLWLLRLPILAMVVILGLFSRVSSASGMTLDIVGTLNSIQQILGHVGPMLSAVLFIVAGIFYALGQLFPSYKRATLHTMAIDMIIGAIIVAVLSVTASSFALASTHLLVNTTSNTL
ncbi:MAG: hypothetical protein M1354_01700 [Candidatus Marsarchaeota archaeon]|jgi:hypothetical protein|nr:hypothetical protein [Candidatus Marsarchaeota archaeon]